MFKNLFSQVDNACSGIDSLTDPYIYIYIEFFFSCFGKAFIRAPFMLLPNVHVSYLGCFLCQSLELTKEESTGI